MDELIKSILKHTAGSAVGILVLAYLLFNPEKIEKWSALMWKLLDGCGHLFRSANKRYIKYDLQARVNDFARQIGHQAPYLGGKRVSVEWADSTVTRESFLQDGQVILRLRREDPQDLNLIHGAYLFVSASLLYKLKRYISQSQRVAVDLYVTTKLIENEKHEIIGRFLDEYLHPQIRTGDDKVSEYYDRMAKLDQAGLFYPVLLQELSFLGDKVFGGRQSDRIIVEVNDLLAFLHRIATRKVGEERDPVMEGEFCRTAIMIIGKKQKITPGGDVWIRFIRDQLIPKGVETLYLLGRLENKSVINNVCSELSSTFAVVRTRQADVPLEYEDGKKEQIRQYLVVLRKQGVKLYQAT